MGAKDQRAYGREWLRRRRAEWVAKKGGECVRCRSTEQLEFHHRDPAKKTENMSHLWSRREEVIAAEVEKCDLLCRSCHKRETRLQKAAGHPSWSQYQRRGCRCDACVEFAREGRRKYRPAPTGKPLGRPRKDGSPPRPRKKPAPSLPAPEVRP